MGVFVGFFFFIIFIQHHGLEMVATFLKKHRPEMNS